MNRDGQEHLKARLAQFIKDLSTYELKLLQRRQQSPANEQEIYLLVERIQLEICHYEDELRQINESTRLPDSRVRYKLSIFMESYSKLVADINRCLLAKPSDKVPFGQQGEEPMSFRKQQPKRLKNIRNFIEDLNNSWMLDLLNQQKIKKSKTKHKNIPKKKSPSKQPSPRNDRRKEGIRHLNKQIMCLYSLSENLQSSYEVHRHKSLEDEISTLKDEENSLVKGLNQVKESNQYLKEQYEALQKELEELRSINKTIQKRYFDVA